MEELPFPDEQRNSPLKFTYTNQRLITVPTT
jgi:hypothetical protein